MTSLFLANLPHDCTVREVQQWVESRGFVVRNLRIVRDDAAYSTPALAYLALHRRRDHASAQLDLDGQALRDHAVKVRIVADAPRFILVPSI